MNPGPSKEFRVGLVGITALLILILGTIWGKDIRLKARAVQVPCLFENSGGLRTGDPVTINGVKRGTVDRITLQGKYVLVMATLDADVELFADARARISMTDLMGGYKLEVLPGHAQQKLDLQSLQQQPLRGEHASGIPELIAEAMSLKMRVDTILVDIQQNVHALREVVEPEHFGLPLKRSVANLESASTNLRAFFENNEARLETSLTNLEVASTRLRSIVEDNDADLSTSLQRLPAIVNKLDSATTALHEVGRQLQKKDGTLAKLVYSDEAYNDLRHAIMQIDSTAMDVRRNLGRFLNGADIKLINLIEF